MKMNLEISQVSFEQARANEFDSLLTAASDLEDSIIFISGILKEEFYKSDTNQIKCPIMILNGSDSQLLGN